MRNFGGLLLVLGVLGFFYCSSRMADLPPLPPGLSVRDALQLPAGKYQVGEYASAMVGATGLLFLMFPKGR